MENQPSPTSSKPVTSTVQDLYGGGQRGKASTGFPFKLGGIGTYTVWSEHNHRNIYE